MAAGFSIAISATDKASGVIERLNKRLTALQAPARRFNRQVSKLADLTGVTRLTEGMRSLGSRSLETFRSLDRIVPALGVITGAASLAGMATLVTRWGELGQRTQFLGQKLGIPTDRLTALRGAARLAGSSAEDLNAGLGALDEKLRGATFRGDATAIQTFNALGVNFGQIGVKARSADEALSDVAEGIKRLYGDGTGPGRGAALRAAQNLGLEALFPLLLKGREGIQALSAEAAKLGMIISPEAAKQADALQASFSRVGEAAEGLGNKITQKLSPVLAPLLNQFANWIADNSEIASSKLVDWVKDLGTGIQAVVGWSKQLIDGFSRLGYGGVLGTGWQNSGPWSPSSSAPGTDQNAPFSIWRPWTWEQGFFTPPPDAAAPAEPFSIWRPWTWLRRSSAGAPGTLAPLDPQIEAEVRRQAALKGLDPDHMVRLAEAEHGGYDAVSDRGAIGTMQLTPETAHDLRIDPHDWHQNVEGGNRYYRSLLDRFGGNYAVADAAYNAGPNNPAVGFFARTGDPSQLPEKTRRYIEEIDRQTQGHVQVDIHMRGAPPGTSARVTADGAVSAPPPRIETAMPGY